MSDQIQRTTAVNKVLAMMDEGTRSLVELHLFDQCSRFHRHLWKAFETADKDNLVLLTKGFPLYAAAWNNYKYTPNWWDNTIQRVIKASELRVVDNV